MTNRIKLFDYILMSFCQWLQKSKPSEKEKYWK